MTVVELMVTMVILVIAVLGLSSTMISSMKLEQVNEETATAAEAANAMAAQIQAQEFDDIFFIYNETAADDPFAGAPGPNFEVVGLPPRPEDADGFVGQILFPTVGNELREDVVMNELSMPRDINADGAVDGLDHSANYRLLPVLIRLEWRGVAGNRRLDTPLLLVE